MKKAIKILLISLGCITGVIGLLFTLGILLSPGQTPPITDEKGDSLPNSIASLEKIKLGGVDQWILIRGTNLNNPVLLFLHGGPGSPEMPMVRYFNPELEEHFIVVNWDQRGSGKSYDMQMPHANLSIDLLVNDTQELSERLRIRFNKEKIFIMGHSWGSALGMLAIHKNPNPYYAYFGIGQVVNMEEGEKISYKFVLEKAKETGDKKALQELTTIGPPPYLGADGIKKLLVERDWATTYGGAWYGKTNIYGAIKPVLFSKGYTLTDKGNYMRGALKTIETPWTPIMALNLFAQVPSVDVPVYFFQGMHDYQTPYILTKSYYEALKAPQKELYTFSNAAHSPNYEQPQEFYDILFNQIMPQYAPQNKLTSR